MYTHKSYTQGDSGPVLTYDLSFVYLIFIKSRAQLNSQGRFYDTLATQCRHSGHIYTIVSCQLPTIVSKSGRHTEFWVELLTY